MSGTIGTNDIRPGDPVDVQISDTLTLSGTYVSLGGGILLVRVAGALHVINNYYYFTKGAPSWPKRTKPKERLSTPKGT